MLAEREIPLTIAIDGAPERCETIAYSAGAYVLALATTLADRAISLHSTYTGTPDTGTLASHLLLARGAYRAIAAEHDHDSLPLTHRRRHLLYDHLHQLSQQLADLGLAARIDLDERAITAIED